MKAAVSIPSGPDLASRRRFVCLLLLILGWGAACLGGIHQLWRYNSTPGSVGSVPARWPESSGLARPSRWPTLILFAHPHCTCTQASLEEFARLFTHLNEQVAATVVIDVSEVSVDAPAASETWQRANRISGANVVTDSSGRETAVFGVQTSGHVVLYGVDGALLFSGGITASRGHRGTNPATRQVEELIRNQNVQTGASWPVFGCSLSTNKNCCQSLKGSRS